MTQDNPNSSRRRFFRHALRSILDSVEELVEDRTASWPAASPSHSPVAKRQTQKIQLRPPGAKPEAEFLELCQQEHACIAACPVAAIQKLHSEDSRKDGTPIIVASERACVVCDDLSCMKACPSGALELVSKEQIQMGWAVVEVATCHRTHGEECTICIERCPLGSQAIDLDPQGQVSVHGGCIGCGVCEYYCPTSPKAIRIVPR